MKIVPTPKVIDDKERSRLQYEVYISSKDSTEAGKWCAEQFGPRWSPVSNRTGLWSYFWGGHREEPRYRFCFAHEQDMMLFILRWS